jgi:hypothetical protein
MPAMSQAVGGPGILELLAMSMISGDRAGGHSDRAGGHGD